VRGGGDGLGRRLGGRFSWLMLLGGGELRLRGKRRGEEV
jgi:hypothetical protein